MKRKFSVFISSTYEDLKEQRQALMGVALENNFIPVGMEQFHAAPASQWDVITKMIDECDFYLLVIGGRYGSIDEEADISYTEKEYNYAKNKGLPVLVFVRESSAITASEQDTGDSKFEKMRKLDEFRIRVQHDGNTVDYFTDLNSLKYAASVTFRNAINYVDEKAGWVRYSDIVDLFKETVEARNKANAELGENQQKLIIGTSRGGKSVAGQDDVGSIPVDSAFLLVYAADGDGQILKIQTLSSPTEVCTSGKQFMADNSRKESARWVEALDRLVEWGWVKPVGYKGETFELTGTGYSKADWLKDGMGIDTSKDPLDELKEFEE